MGLRFANKQEAINSVKRVQQMLDNKEIELKDAVIAAYIMSKRAELHKYQTASIKDGGLVWEEYLKQLKRKDEI